MIFQLVLAEQRPIWYLFRNRHRQANSGLALDVSLVDRSEDAYLFYQQASTGDPHINKESSFIRASKLFYSTRHTTLCSSIVHSRMIPEIPVHQPR
jgi:hypothetical protein